MLKILDPGSLDNEKDLSLFFSSDPLGVETLQGPPPIFLVGDAHRKVFSWCITDGDPKSPINKYLNENKIAFLVERTEVDAVQFRSALPESINQSSCPILGWEPAVSCAFTVIIEWIYKSASRAPKEDYGKFVSYLDSASLVGGEEYSKHQLTLSSLGMGGINKPIPFIRSLYDRHLRPLGCHPYLPLGKALGELLSVYDHYHPLWTRQGAVRAVAHAGSPKLSSPLRPGKGSTWIPFLTDILSAITDSRTELWYHRLMAAEINNAVQRNADKVNVISIGRDHLMGGPDVPLQTYLFPFFPDRTLFVDTL